MVYGKSFFLFEKNVFEEKKLNKYLISNHHIIIYIIIKLVEISNLYICKLNNNYIAK